tara:strand:- start:219 stop:1130 length:912 start_codon:yes stop_codon:yes gene_type:complete
MAGLTTLYRGEPWFGPSTMLNLENQGYRASNKFVNKAITGLESFKNLTYDDLARLSGQYWTTSPDYAGTYAGSTGKIKSMKVPSNYLDKFSKFENRVTDLSKFKHAGNPPGAYLVPKSTLKNYPSKLNVGKTIGNIAKDVDYPFKYGMKNPITTLVDEAKIIKAGYNLFGPGEALKDIGKLGLRYGAKGLGYLASLPAQTALMTLMPTTVNQDEADMTAEDFKKMQMLEDFFSKRRNIPGTPIVPAGARFYGHDRGRDEPSGGGGGWSPSGADLSPGGGYGQSPTGSDIAGTPFSRGGILGAF